MSLVIACEGLQVKQMEDEADLVGAARCDPVALGQLYQRYAKRVDCCIYSRVRDQAEADDLTSLVFISIWNALPGYSEHSAFAAWVFRIARNKVINHYHRSRSTFPLSDPQETFRLHWDPLDKLGHDDDLRRLSVVVEGLPVCPGS